MSATVPAAAALKRTPLYELHRKLGARLIDFGGWEMPVQYSGILEEHRAVRERVGIFDVSHMGELELTGEGALAAVSRTGYTGEDGFELYLAPEHAERVFGGLLEEGRGDGATPCGLGARDTLRLEARMALYGNDIDDTVTPWEADLGWIV